MKKFLLGLSILLVAGAGCKKNDSSPGNNPPASNQAAVSDPCAALKTASGEPLITAPEAAAILGGAWPTPGSYSNDVGCGYTIMSDEMPDAETRFRFVSLSAVQPFVYEGVLKTKVDRDPSFGYRDVPGLGDEAFFQWPNDSTRALNTLLYIKKGGRVISVGSRGASEDQILKLGQTVAGRW